MEPEWSEAASSVADIGDGTAAAGEETAKSPDRHTFVGKAAAADVADKRTEQPDGSEIFGDAKADGDGVSAGRQPAQEDPGPGQQRVENTRDLDEKLPPPPDELAAVDASDGGGLLRSCRCAGGEAGAGGGSVCMVS